MGLMLSRRSTLHAIALHAMANVCRPDTRAGAAGRSMSAEADGEDALRSAPHDVTVAAPPSGDKGRTSHVRGCVLQWRGPSHDDVRAPDRVDLTPLQYALLTRGQPPAT